MTVALIGILGAVALGLVTVLRLTRRGYLEIDLLAARADLAEARRANADLNADLNDLDKRTRAAVRLAHQDRELHRVHARRAEAAVRDLIAERDRIKAVKERATAEQDSSTPSA